MQYHLEREDNISGERQRRRGECTIENGCLYIPSVEAKLTLHGKENGCCTQNDVEKEVKRGVKVL